MQIEELRRMSQSGASAMPHMQGIDTAQAGSRRAASGSDPSTPDLSVQLAGFGAISGNHPIYNRQSLSEETVIDDIAGKAASFSDAQTFKNELSMAASGVTDMDIQEFKEKGYSPKDMDADEIRTTTDMIREQLVKGKSDLGAMEQFASEEIEALPGGREAYAMAMEMAESSAVTADGLDASAAEYLVSNRLDPTISNTYQAVFSTPAGSSVEGAPVDMEALDGQVRQVIDRANLPADERQMENARELLSKDIPLTPENLSYFDELTTADISLTESRVMEQIESAVSEGRSPGEAYLLPGYSLADRAQHAYEVVAGAAPEDAVAAMDSEGRLTVAALDEVQLRRERGLAVGEADGVGTSGSVDGAGAADGANGVGASGGAGGAGGTGAAESADGTGSVVGVDGAGMSGSTDGAGVAGGADGAGVAENVSAADVLSGGTQDAAALRARRVLEETRLVMTQEANYSLLKRGISIDTRELSALVEDLRAEETAFARANLTQGEVLTEQELTARLDLFEQTNEQVETVKNMPAMLLGRMPEPAEQRIGDLVSAGREVLSGFSAMEQRYETVGTQVRRDLGDSITKAFRNVDDILEDIGLETSESNERAVRILAYNRREITVESVAEMREADQEVSRALKSLTPGVVAKMIKEGENPLDLSMRSLRERAEEIRSESSADSDEERYAAFLFKAQQSGEINEQERDAFIGVYRLIYQVEKTDGAVIGQLMQQGSDITLRNMMGAVRTRRSEGRSFTIDDDTQGFVSTRTELTVTEQIEKAFMTERMKDAGGAMTPGRMQQFENEDAYMNMNPDQFATALEQMAETPEDVEAEQAYRQELANEMKAAVASEERVYEILSRFDVGTSPANLEAVNEMLKNRNAMFTRLFPKGSRRTFSEVSSPEASEDVEISDVKEDILEAFGEAVKTPQDMAEAQMKLEDIATNVMKGFLIEQKVRQVDIRGMQMSVKQIKTMGEMGKRSETYAIPIMVADEMGNLSLKIVRGKTPERGALDVSLDMESIGAVSMTIQVSADAVTGRIDAERRETLEMLQRHEETLVSAIGYEEVSISYSETSTIDANAIFDKENGDYGFEPADPGDEKPEVQTRTLYNIARSLIDAVASIG